MVVRDLPREPRNAPLLLFSAVREQVEYAQSQYRKRSANTSSLVEQLMVRYQAEGIVMPYTMEDFRREVKERVLRELTAEERLDLFRHLPVEEAQELIQELPAEKRLEGLTRIQIEEYLKKLTGNDLRNAEN